MHLCSYWQFVIGALQMFDDDDDDDDDALRRCKGNVDQEILPTDSYVHISVKL